MRLAGEQRDACCCNCPSTARVLTDSLIGRVLAVVDGHSVQSIEPQSVRHVERACGTLLNPSVAGRGADSQASLRAWHASRGRARYQVNCNTAQYTQVYLNLLLCEEATLCELETVCEPTYLYRSCEQVNSSSLRQRSDLSVGSMKPRPPPRAQRQYHEVETTSIARARRQLNSKPESFAVVLRAIWLCYPGGRAPGRDPSPPSFVPKNIIIPASSQDLSLQFSSPNNAAILGGCPAS